IVQMILRLDYLVILYSGGDLLAVYFNGEDTFLAIIKALAGIWVIVAMEMIAVKTAKDKPVGSWWIQFIISVLITLILGFGFLNLGILPYACGCSIRLEHLFFRLAIKTTRMRI